MSLVQLPHGATIEPETGEISIALGQVTLNFSLEEWESFVLMIDDISTVIQANSVENMVQCPTCNTVSRYVHYEEPTEEELN
jgi:hypothetical protein